MGVGLEAIQLRVAGIAAGFTTEDSLGQQRFAPQSDQPLRVQVLRMQ